ncbi:MAG: hypothetical protein HKO13_07770 [Sphingomonas sp.]|nr:hypothetical protein [Sphingomonas sp.]RZV53004.1 MAG: hypothetical protein EX258_01115 [Sphingomonadaceae bacterium]
MRLPSIAAALLAIAAPAAAQPQPHEPTDPYRITMLRAAPGQWVAMRAKIEALGEQGSIGEDGCTIPFRIRHSQGDQWDFMLLQPYDSFQAYFANDCDDPAWRRAIAEHADFESDWFANGPSHGLMQSTAAETGLFHLEMFKARAGMKDVLLDSRIRENAIFADIGMRQNFIWAGNLGSDYDVMTIGMHTTWATYAEHNAAGTDVEWATYSRRHGYDGGSDLAPQLRSFLTSHNDGFAVPMQ